MVSENNVAQFLSDMKMFGKTDATIKTYKRILTKYNIDISSINKKDIAEIHRGMVGLKPATLKTYTAAIRSYLQWLYRNGKTSVDYSPFVIPTRAIKSPERLPTTITPKAWVNSFYRIKGQSFSAIRDRAIMGLLACTGARSGELTNLKVNDIDLEKWEIRVIIKGNREFVRTILDILPNGISIKRLLHKYIKVRDELLKKLNTNSDFFFINAYGEKFSHLHIMGKRWGIKYRMHVLGRKYCATTLIDMGINRQDVLDIIGWKSDMLSRYVNPNRDGVISIKNKMRVK